MCDLKRKVWSQEEGCESYILHEKDISFASNPLNSKKLASIAPYNQIFCEKKKVTMLYNELSKVFSLFRKYRTVNCIDIGDGTVDLLVIRNGQPDLSIRVSDRTGMAVMRSEIANMIQQNFGLHLESCDVEQVLMNEATVLDEKVVKEIHRMADEWFTLIVNKLHTHVKDFRTNPAVFLGGGSLLLRQQIEHSPDFKYVEFIDDVRANAIGYEKMVAARMSRM